MLNFFKFIIHKNDEDFVIKLFLYKFVQLKNLWDIDDLVNSKKKKNNTLIH